MAKMVKGKGVAPPKGYYAYIVYFNKTGREELDQKRLEYQNQTGKCVTQSQFGRVLIAAGLEVVLKHKKEGVK